MVLLFNFLSGGVSPLGRIEEFMTIEKNWEDNLWYAFHRISDKVCCLAISDTFTIAMAEGFAAIQARKNQTEEKK